MSPSTDSEDDALVTQPLEWSFKKVIKFSISSMFTLKKASRLRLRSKGEGGYSVHLEALYGCLLDVYIIPTHDSLASVNKKKKKLILGMRLATLWLRLLAGTNFNGLQKLCALRVLVLGIFHRNVKFTICGYNFLVETGQITKFSTCK